MDTSRTVIPFPYRMVLSEIERYRLILSLGTYSRGPVEVVFGRIAGSTIAMAVLARHLRTYSKNIMNANKQGLQCQE